MPKSRLTSPDDYSRCQFYYSWSVVIGGDEGDEGDGGQENNSVNTFLVPYNM